MGGRESGLLSSLERLTMRKVLIHVLLIAAIPHLAATGDSSNWLVVGDAAPTIDDVSWYRGEKHSSWETGHIYVIDFWATWCPPCIKGLRRLQNLHEKYGPRQVHFIAVAIWPTEKSRPPEDVVDRFPDLSYSFAIDNGSSTADLFMVPTRSAGLPKTMVIDRRGNLAWVGDPSDGFEEALEALVAGEFEISQARKDDLIRLRAGEFIGQASAAEKAGNFQPAIDFIDQAIAVDPDRFSVYRGWQYEIALLRLEDPTTAKKIAENFLASPQGKDPYSLYVLAARIVNNFEGTPPQHRDLDLALRCARQSVDNSPEPDFDRLALLAEVHALRGEYDSAINRQRDAVDLAEGSDERPARKSLEGYIRLAEGSPD